MLKVKKITYDAIRKNNKLTKLTADIKQAIQTIENEKNKENKAIKDYAKMIQSIKKEYQKLALVNEILKKKGKRLEDKQFMNDLIENNKKQQQYFDKIENDTTNNNRTKISPAKLILSFTCQKKANKKEKNISLTITKDMKNIKI